jgi:hypothetical protein
MLESLAHPYLQVTETALEHLTVPFFGFAFEIFCSGLVLALF